MLLFLLLAVVLLSTSLAHGKLSPASANNMLGCTAPNDVEISSPLMLFGWWGSSEKRPEPGNATDQRGSQTAAIERDNTLAEREDSLSEPWVIVHAGEINPKSQASLLTSIIIGANHTNLNRELSSEDLLRAREASISLRTQAQDLFKESANRFNEQTRNEEQHNSIKTLIASATKETEALRIFSQQARSRLPQRNVILENGGENIVQQLIDQTETSGNSIITTLQEKLTISQDIDEKQKIVNQIIKTAGLVQKLQQLMLGCHTPFYITTAKESLDALFQQISSDPKLQDLRTSFENRRTRFLFAEAESPAAALTAVTDMIQELQSEVIQISTDLDRASNLQQSIRNEDKGNFEMCLQQKEAVKKSLERTMLLYSQIENELMIETEAGSLVDLKESIEADLEELNSILQNNRASHPALEQLKGILTNPEFPIADRIAAPQNPLSFLSALKLLNECHADAIITGENGKIILSKTAALLPTQGTAAASEETKESLSEALTPSDQNPKKSTNGMNLIRFALARKYGMQAVGLFDTHFSMQKTFRLGLSVKNVQQFLQTIDSIHSSHFLSPLTSIETFMAKLQAARQDEPLKWNENVFGFNPFLPDAIAPTTETLEAINQKELSAGIQHAKEAVEKRLITFSTTQHGIPITQNRAKAILKRFDHQFSQRPFLTAKNLLSFIATEEEKIAQSRTNFWEDHVTDDMKKTIMLGALSGTASLSVTLFAKHLLALNLYCFSIGAIIGFLVSHIVLPMLL